MRILQAIHDFLPEHCAGSEIYTFHLARALAARGHDVRLLFTEKRLERPQFEVTPGRHAGLPFHEIVYNRHFFDVVDLYDDPRMEAPIGAVLDQVAPDVLHIQSLVYLGLPLVRAAAARGVPMVMTLHEYFLCCARGGLLLDLDGRLCDPIRFENCARCIEPYPLLRERYPDGEGAAFAELGSLRHCARAIEARTERLLAGVRPIRRFVAPSRFLRELLVEKGLDPARVVHADYGFPAPPPLARVERAAGAPLRLAYLGTLADYKGVHLAVEAFLRLRRGEATLRLKGETSWFPDYTGPLLEKARSIPGLTFEGAVPPGAGYGFLAEVDLLLVPSLWYENSPLTIHEAFQSGVPVIATDLGGMAELAGAGGGLLFRRGDAADLTRCLRRVLDEPGLLESLRQSIPAVKTIEENAAEMEALYLEV